MKITEKPSDLSVSKIKMNTDQIDESIPKPLPNILTFFMILVGAPGSGKTNLLVNLIATKNKCYYQKYDRVYFISPSQHTIDKDLKFNPDRCFTTFSDDILQHIIDTEEQEQNRILIILDDVVAQIAKNNKTLLRFIYNRRHLGAGTSIIITTQKYNKLPLEIRCCASDIFLFRPSNKKELLDFHSELVNLDYKDFEDVCRYTFQNRHDFLYYSITNQAYHRNFNRLIFSSNINEGQNPEGRTDTDSKSSNQQTKKTGKKDSE